MAAGVIRNFHLQSPPSRYFPVILQHFPPEEKREEEEEREEIIQADKYEEEEEEEEENGDSEAFEEDEEECSEEFALSPAPHLSDVTSRLLRYADLINRDVQRYFGRCPDDRAARDIYDDAVSVKASGRLRYYDDLLRMARTGSSEESEPAPVTTAKGPGVWVSNGNTGLGPLAELFDQRGQSQGRPMSKRHLPLSFWTEPIPCCAMLELSHSPGFSPGSAHVNEHTNHNVHTQHSTHTPDNTHPDFSDLLAYWDPHPELTHTLTETTQTL
ncbi:protein PERCC1 [Aplochiton taeniatus]